MAIAFNTVTTVCFNFIILYIRISRTSNLKLVYLSLILNKVLYISVLNALILGYRAHSFNDLKGNN